MVKKCTKNIDYINPILLQSLGPLSCLLATGVLVGHTCLSQNFAIGFDSIT